MADADEGSGPIIHRAVETDDAAPPALVAHEGGAVRLEQLIEAVAAPTLVITADEAIQTLNAAAAGMFGYTRTELLGAPADILLPERYRAMRDPQQRSLWAPQERWEGKLIGRRKDGSEFPIEIALHPIGTGSAPLVYCSILDLAARQRTEAAMRSSVSTPASMSPTI